MKPEHATVLLLRIAGKPCDAPKLLDAIDELERIQKDEATQLTDLQAQQLLWLLDTKTSDGNTVADLFVEVLQNNITMSENGAPIDEYSAASLRMDIYTKLCEIAKVI